MKKMRLISVLIVMTLNLNAQTNNKFVKYFRENITHLNLEYYVFFEHELLVILTDTSYRRQFETVLSQQIQKINKSNSEISKERQIFLYTFYHRINQVSVKSEELQNSKSYLLKKLMDYKKLDFVVDKGFLSERINPERRGMPFGDEECDFDYTLYTFFLYDPKLYLNSTINDKIANPTGEILFPSKCFLEELSELPFEMKTKLQSEFLKKIAHYNGVNFEQLRNIIKSADLNAKYD